VAAGAVHEIKLQRREIRVKVRDGFNAAKIILERDVFVGRMSVFVR
jgi:hypothetical protein